MSEPKKKRKPRGGYKKRIIKPEEAKEIDQLLKAIEKWDGKLKYQEIIDRYRK
jgi:hypothetical protein